MLLRETAKTEDLSATRDAIGARIAGRQAALAKLMEKRLIAERHAGNARWAYGIEVQRASPRVVQEYRDMVLVAEDASSKIREDCSALQNELADLHAQIDSCSRAIRLNAALGGRELALVAVPGLDFKPPAAVIARRNAIAEKLAAARSLLESATSTLETAQARAAAIRVQFHLEKATKEDVARVEREVTTAATVCDERRRDCADLASAVELTSRELRDLENAAHANWYPAMDAEYRRRLQIFADALRTAVIASEQLFVIWSAMGGGTRLAPWHELRVMDDESKFNAWIRAALEQGLVT